MPGFLDRRRASLLMKEQGLSALVLAQPESITYATGAFPGVASFWRRAGAAFVVVPADETAPLSAIVGDLQAQSFAAQSGIADVRSHRIWVETGRHPEADAAKPKRTPRPAQYDLAASLAHLRDILSERGWHSTPVGLELGFVPAADFQAIAELPVSWKDCTRIVERLRAIKHPAELAHLRHAADFADGGFADLVAAVRPGMNAAELTDVWKAGATATSQRLAQPAPQSAWAYIAVGGDGFQPGGPARAGDIIKIDIGCVVQGYSSDFGRTAVLGRADPKAVEIHDALHRAFDAGFALLKPGTALKDIYRATASTMWEQGLETYGRGHFGHGVGASIWSEEWPFIAETSDAVLEPGMVMAFETPWYIEGLGGFIIEDMVHILDQGCEILTPRPRELMKL